MAKRTAKVDLSKIDRKKLDDLIAKRSQVLLVSPQDVFPNPYNKNKMGAQYFAALKANMANPSIGFTMPILVRPHAEKEGAWMIVDGEHRWKASKEIGLDRIPAINLDDMPEALAKFIMLESNAVRGATDDADQKKILEEIENDPVFAEFDIWAATVTDAPMDDASKYALDEEELDATSEETTQVALYFTGPQMELYRKIVGQLRLARGITAEAAVIECIQFFGESTGFGDPTGDESVDAQKQG